MPLTSAQLAALKTDIIAASDQACVDLEADPTNADKAFAVAELYNLPAATDFWGNYKSVPLADIKAAITFKNYTQNDAVPTDTALNVAIHQARALVCQTYQINVNNLLLVGNTFDATKANLVTGLKDATNSDMPSGTGGAGRKGGWTEVQKVICRKGTRAEKLFADTANGNGSANTAAATFTFEGSVTITDVLAAMAT